MRKMIHPGRAGVLAFFIAVAVLLTAPVADAAKVQIPEGTAVKVSFPSTIKISSSELGEGIPILFNLAEPIEIGGKVIVEKGATGTAVVKEVKKAGKGGKPGKIVLEFVDLAPKGTFLTLDGENVKLKGVITAEGKGKKTLSYLFIFGLFIKGGQGEIPTDKIYTATVAESVILEEK